MMLRRSLRAFVLVVVPAVVTFQLALAEMSVDEKKMEAAAIVLGAASQMGGTVVVEDGGDRAYIRARPAFDLGDIVTFEKVSDCIYAEVVKGGQSIRDQHSVIDFSKLTGRWGERGDLIEFYSKGSSHCTSLIAGCWQNHLHIAMNRDHRQMVDDVSYLLRHGCDASVDSDPNPH